MKRPAVFLDRDNTIIHNDGDLGDPAQVRLIQGVASAIASLCGLGYKVVVVTNQGGVARGLYSEDDVHAVHRRIEEMVVERSNGARIDGFYFCPFHPQGKVKRYCQDHPNRKPLPGMLLEAAKDLDIELSQSWMVGDQSRDVEAGAAAGCRTILLRADWADTSPDDFRKSGKSNASNDGELSGAGGGVEPSFTAKGLVEAVRIIASQRKPEASEEISRTRIAGKRWDAEAMARLQQLPRRAKPDNDAIPPAAMVPANSDAVAPAGETTPAAESPAVPPAVKPQGAAARPFVPWARQQPEQPPRSADPEPVPAASVEPSPTRDDTDDTPAEPAEPSPAAVDPVTAVTTPNLTSTPTVEAAASASTPVASPRLGRSAVEGVDDHAETVPRRAVVAADLRGYEGDDIEDDSDFEEGATLPRNPPRDPVHRTLRMILHELRTQRGTSGEMPQLTVVAIVIQAVVILCLLGALWMGSGDGGNTAFFRWATVAILLQLTTIATLLFARNQ